MVSTPYQLVKFELLPEKRGARAQVNADGVAQTAFVATLMRQGPYQRPEFIMSPCYVEGINMGLAHTMAGLKMNLDWVDAKRHDDEKDKEHELAVWFEEYRNDVAGQDPAANALLDANIPGWRNADTEEESTAPRLVGVELNPGWLVELLQDIAKHIAPTFRGVTERTWLEDDRMRDDVDRAFLAYTKGRYVDPLECGVSASG